MGMTFGSGISITGGLSVTSPPSDPYFSYTTLLLPGNGTNNAQNNTFLDSSTNNFTVTRAGNTTQGTLSPFSASAPYSASTKGGSMYFDGTGDYLTTPSSLAMALGSTFTVECWIYVLAWNVSGPTILDVRDSNIVGAIYLENNGTARMQTTATSTIASQTGITLNTWIHVAFVSDATSSRVYVNGSNTGATNQGQALFPTTAKAGFIGADFSGGYGFNGYISNMRVVKGTALYTANFTPPTSPLTAISGTSLLLSATNAGIIDNTMLNDLETVGDAKISTTQSKFGESSMSFDGTGDWLVSPVSTNLGMGSGDFTIEGWFYATNPTYAQGFFHINATPIGGTVAGYAIGVTASGAVQYYSGGTYTTSSSTVTANTWTHLAMVRSAGTVKVYVNGTLPASGGSIADSQNVTSALAYLGVFYAVSGGPYTMTGYINDFRVTKGIARYTANFTPPTTAFPLY